MSDIQVGFRRGRGTRDQIANICQMMEKTRELQKNISTLVSLTTLKPLTMWVTKKCGKFLEMEIPDHFTCLLRILYAKQEAKVRTGHGTMDWFKLGKEYIKAVYCHPVY